MNIIIALAKINDIDGEDDLRKTSLGMGEAFGAVEARAKEIIAIGIPSREVGSLPEILKDLGERVLFRYLDEMYQRPTKEPES